MLYERSDNGRGGSGRKENFPGWIAGRVFCWHGPGLASLPEQYKRTSPYRYV